MIATCEVPGVRELLGDTLRYTHSSYLSVDGEHTLAFSLLVRVLAVCTLEMSLSGVRGVVGVVGVVGVGSVLARPWVVPPLLHACSFRDSSSNPDTY